MNVFEPSSTAAELKQRAAVYRLLARLWRREIDLKLLRELRKPALRLALESVGGVIPDEEDESRLLDQLSVAYCQLLVGPQEHISPYQSVWTEGRFEGEAVGAMQSYLDIIGDHGDWRAIKPIDHFASQLDIMGYLLEQTAELSENDTDVDNRTALEDLTSSFFRDHVAWTTQLFTEVESRSEVKFYRTLARIARELVANDAT